MGKPYKKFVWARRDQPRKQFVWARRDYQPTEEELSNIYADESFSGESSIAHEAEDMSLYSAIDESETLYAPGQMKIRMTPEPESTEGEPPSINEITEILSEIEYEPGMSRWDWYWGRVKFLLQEPTPEGCFSDSDCPGGQICVPGPEGGTCTEESVSLIIRGQLDNRTCNYCRSQFGTFRSLDSHNLPPFHDHCRCWAELVFN